MASIVLDVDVSGADEIIAKLLNLQGLLKNFSDAFTDIERVMYENERDTIPVRGGGARASIRSSSTAMQATVKAGGGNRKSHAGGIYVHKLDTGGGATGSYGPHYIAATLFAQEALEMSVPFAVQRIETSVATKIAQAGL